VSLVWVNFAIGTFYEGITRKGRKGEKLRLKCIVRHIHLPQVAKYSATPCTFNVIKRGSTRNKHWLIILAPTVKLIAPQNIVATKVAELVDYMDRLGPLNGWNI
jgi:hypothetical protein